MNKNENKLTPELRFPEFLKDGEWEEEDLGIICDYFNGASHEGGVNEEGNFYLISLNSIDIEGNLKKDMKRLSYTDNSLKKNDIVMVLSDVAHGNFLGLTDIIPNNNFVLNQRMAGLRIKNTDDFVPFYIKTYINNNQKYFKNKGQGSSQLNLSKASVTDFSILFPNPTEQQKIASCLSSLDELLTAHTDKLEILKTHKKGLMQNLFPQNGEKTPKLRFKEFENDGEWVEDKLGNIGNPSMCKRIFKEETTNDEKNGIPFYKIGTFGKIADSFISKERYEEYKMKYSFPKKGDILISASGTIGRLVVYDGEPAFFQDSNIVWIDNDESKTTNKFLFYAYSLLNWQTSDGGIIQRLYNADLKGMIVHFPKNKKEQQKIADTLSSLDTLIAAQADRIEQLKLHKKGLLQGLFPKVKI
ncbi:type I restriction enzyme S subunit [Flavobacterium croceum DSM 17960]|uniref:Type I restriction enzyme S subunit n=1 Tax=Flavobacterium croceum DSM 17960 TaxID=1121886 RepID=A0A2S4N992_9FLAO|nr:restriction endonuclease subunit S [Flavobacterium croceum]POS02274.1 type I restriction enzyme S subunit [Flavobacterium croceum DSM 17960]